MSIYKLFSQLSNSTELRKRECLDTRFSTHTLLVLSKTIWSYDKLRKETAKTKYSNIILTKHVGIRIGRESLQIGNV